LLAQPLGDDGDVNEFQQFMGVGPQAPAIQRRQDTRLAAEFGIMDRRVRLVTVDVQRAAAAEVQMRERVDMIVVAAADDGALAILRHDEGER
jgi:hypothetical protein